LSGVLNQLRSLQYLDSRQNCSTNSLSVRWSYLCVDYLFYWPRPV